MAKGKHSAALFEVFHGTKAVDRRGTPSLRTPSWWFKGREGNAESSIDPNDPTTRPIKSPLVSSRATVPVVELKPEPVAAPILISDTVLVSEPKPIQNPLRREPVRVMRDAADPTRGRTEVRGDSSSRFEIDHTRREVTLRLRVTTAIVTGFVIIVTVGLAYVLGRKAAAPDVLSADTVLSEGVDSTRSHLAQPASLNVPRRPKANTSSRADDSHGHDQGPAAPISNSVHGLNEIPPDAVGAADGPRIIGVNYVIAQSYPNASTANEACEYLNKNGVPCTVESAPSGWPKTWYSVVTKRGFEHIHTPECESYKKKIQILGDKFASKAQFKHFSPFLYAWKPAPISVPL